MPFGLSAFAIKAIGIGLLALGLLGAISWLVHDLKAQGEAELREQVNAATAAQTALDNAETQRRLSEQQGIIRDAQVKEATATRIADTASRERDAYRVQLAAYVRSHQGAASTSTAAGSTDFDGSDPIGVLARLSDESDRLAGVYAKVADNRRIIAEACERSADSVIKK